MVSQVEELPFCFASGYAHLSFLPGQKATDHLKLLKYLRTESIRFLKKQLWICSSVWAGIQMESRILGLGAWKHDPSLGSWKSSYLSGMALGLGLVLGYHSSQREWIGKGKEVGCVQQSQGIVRNLVWLYAVARKEFKTLMPALNPH